MRGCTVTIKPAFIFTAALVATLLPMTAHAEPHCVIMKFFDAQGVAIPTPEPVIAIMVGGTPQIEGSIPIAKSREPGAEVPCPESLIGVVQKIFEDSCLTEQRRNRAAASNNAPRSLIDKRCGDMAVTLGGRIKPTP
jgi:hypothetical protein